MPDVLQIIFCRPPVADFVSFPQDDAKGRIGAPQWSGSREMR